MKSIKLKDILKDPNSEDREILAEKCNDIINTVLDNVSDDLKAYEKILNDPEELKDFLKINHISKKQYEDLELFEFANMYSTYYKIKYNKDQSPVYLPFYNGNLTNSIFKMSKRKSNFDEYGDLYTFKDDQTNYNSEIILNGISKYGDIKPSTAKIFDKAVSLLTRDAFYKGSVSVADCRVELNVDEYAKQNGLNFDPDLSGTPEQQATEIQRQKQRRKKFVNEIHKNLKLLENISWSGEDVSHSNNRKKIKYDTYRILSSHKYANGVFRISFDPDTVEYLTHSYVMQYPECLFMLDNKHVNSYSIGRKIAYQSSNKNNIKKGNNNSLSVQNIIECSPDIMTFDEIDKKGRRDWKVKIKNRIETAMNDLIDVNYIKSWNYRTKQGAKISIKQADELTAIEYSKLFIEFKLKEPLKAIVQQEPDQSMDP